MTPPKTYSNFIDGEWVASASGKTFENVNPANRHELVGLFQKSGPEDVDAAVAAAKQAYKIVEEHSASQARGNPLSRRRLAARRAKKALPKP